jgi:WD40-like Beta Propeller Repeat
MPSLPRLLALALALVLAPAAPAAAADLKPTNLPVNTEADEDDPHLAADGLTLFWTRKAGKKDEIFVATRKRNTFPWPKKGELIEDWIPTKVDDRSAFETGPRWPRYFYYATKKDEKGTNFDLYAAVLDERGKAYSAVRPVPSVNTPADELHPWLSGDGKSLYYSRKTKEGWRVYVATRKDTTGPGNWGEPKEAGLPVGYHHATLTPNGQVMYLQGPLEKGRWGLFVSTRGAKGWGKPAEIAGLNDATGKTGDRSPNLSRDGRILYFASDRKGGKGGLDLYWVYAAQLKAK